jgi:hypothetical protein
VLQITDTFLIPSSHTQHTIRGKPGNMFRVERAVISPIIKMLIQKINTDSRHEISHLFAVLNNLLNFPVIVLMMANSNGKLWPILPCIYSCVCVLGNKFLLRIVLLYSVSSLTVAESPKYFRVFK